MYLTLEMFLFSNVLSWKKSLRVSNSIHVFNKVVNINLNQYDLILYVLIFSLKDYIYKQQPIRRSKPEWHKK